MTTTIGIVGSRRRNTREDFELVRNVVLGIYRKGDVIISGGCPKGGDWFAELIAKELDAPIYVYPALWDVHGRRAGFFRNDAIAAVSEILVACVAPDRTGGTEDTIRKFLDAHGHGQNLYILTPGAQPLDPSISPAPAPGSDLAFDAAVTRIQMATMYL